MTALADRVVLVTGAASGIGAACATLAAQRGARVLLVDRDAERLPKVAEELAMPWEAGDVSDPAVADRFAATCVERLGRIDGLVNAAGVPQTRAYLEITPEEFDRVVGVNLRGAYFVQQAVARRMVDAGRGGSIVNFSSTSARVGRPLATVYGLTKAAILNMTSSTALALASHGIRVNAVTPGIIDTPMVETVRRERAAPLDTTPAELRARWERATPLGRLGTPREVAEVVVFLLSDAASYVTGEELGITGGNDGA